ncbi:MAG: divalent-cation tolerance protein CutA [Candidatus Aminicenantales bacterium]
MTEFILALTTVPDEAKGQEIARLLVEKRLAACVTVTPASRSFYWWQGKICEESEYVLLIKTRRGLFGKLEAALKAVHPYQVPELIALPVELGSQAYLDWLKSETKNG